jgi:hypothetical protein
VFLDFLEVTRPRQNFGTPLALAITREADSHNLLRE